MLGGTVTSPQLDPCVAASMRHRTAVHGATVVVVVEEMGVVDVVGRVLEDTGRSVVLVVDVWRSVVLVGLVVVVEEVELEVGLVVPATVVVVVVGEFGLQTATPCRPSFRPNWNATSPSALKPLCCFPREVFGANATPAIFFPSSGSPSRATWTSPIASS
jgi:hypothetical protein